MKSFYIPALAALFCVVGFLAGLAVTDARAVAAPGQEQGGMPGPEEMKAMMEKWESVVKPGEHHERLKQFAGDWKTTIRVWMGGPGTPASESQGTASYRSILGGRFLLQDAEWKMDMPDFEDPMKMKTIELKGVGLIGYDNYKNQYVNCWADNYNTQILISYGNVDPSGQVFTAYGLMDEPMLDVIGRTVKYVTRIVSEDEHVFSIYDLHAGDDYKVLEITYKRS